MFCLSPSKPSDPQDASNRTKQNPETERRRV
ncbi:hypothetical protein OIU76_001133 [Salix suchowensis]|nr:hypothetical protein OIU76_001133 [Salix suchowensis]